MVSVHMGNHTEAVYGIHERPSSTWSVLSRDCRSELDRKPALHKHSPCTTHFDEYSFIQLLVSRIELD